MRMRQKSEISQVTAINITATRSAIFATGQVSHATEPYGTNREETGAYVT